MRRPREAVTVNVSKEEKKLIEQAADRFHLSVSAFIRMAAMQIAKNTGGGLT